MSALVKTIKSRLTDDTIYPVTKADAVYMGSSTVTTVEGQINDINDIIGSETMGTTATTITGAIAEHEEDISTLNSKITSSTLSYSYKGTKSNEWEYIGQSFTVPTNHKYIVGINQGWSSGNPLGIGLASSATYTTPDHGISGDYVRGSTFIVSPGTWYLYTKRATVPVSENTYTIFILDFNFA